MTKVSLNRVRYVEPRLFCVSDELYAGSNRRVRVIRPGQPRVLPCAGVQPTACPLGRDVYISLRGVSLHDPQSKSNNLSHG